MIEELLPCPWCGVRPTGIEYVRGYRVIIYHAKWCPALDLGHRRKRDTIRLWNTRRAALNDERDALRARVAELEETLNTRTHELDKVRAERNAAETRAAITDSIPWEHLRLACMSGDTPGLSAARAYVRVWIAAQEPHHGNA